MDQWDQWTAVHMCIVRRSMSSMHVPASKLARLLFPEVHTLRVRPLQSASKCAV